MQYERDVLIILREAGSNGLPLKRIALHVYNIRNSIFEPLDRKKLYYAIAQWLRQESLHSEGAVKKMSQWGRYSLNKRSKKVRQLESVLSSDDNEEWMRIL